MPVIVMASPKGGVGKSTCAVLLASEFARMVTGGKMGKALENAKAFTEAVYERLK